MPLFYLMLLLFFSPDAFAMDRDAWELPIFEYKQRLPFFSCDDAFKDIIPLVLTHLSLKDQQSFGLVCKYSNTFPLQPKTLSLIQLPPQKPIITDLTVCFSAMATFTIIYTASQGLDYALPAFGICLMGLCTLKPKGGKTDNAPKISDTKKVLDMRKLTTIYRTIANQLTAKHIIPQALHIDYHEKQQAEPLLNAAREAHIPSVALTIHAASFPKPLPVEPLNLTPILHRNTTLQELSINVFGSYPEGQRVIDHHSFTEAIPHNISLRYITLDNLPLTPELLDTLLSLKQVNALFFYDCNTGDAPYDFAKIAHNTTLHTLFLHDFRQQYMKLSDAIAPHITQFMQQNKKLVTLSIKGHNLSDAIQAQLNASHHKPKDFFI